MEVDDYMYAYRKLREGGLSAVDSDAYHENLKRAWAGMNRHQKELVDRLTKVEGEIPRPKSSDNP
jgi:hypothetical protein